MSAVLSVVVCCDYNCMCLLDTCNYSLICICCLGLGEGRRGEGGRGEGGGTSPTVVYGFACRIKACFLVSSSTECDHAGSSITSCMSLVHTDMLPYTAPPSSSVPTIA